MSATADTIDWQAVAERSLHPIQLQIIELFGADPARRRSPKQILAALGDARASLPLISYHVRTLAERSILRGAGTAPRRGAVEHFYALAAHCGGDHS